jgi:hypothetical protein
MGMVSTEKLAKDKFALPPTAASQCSPRGRAPMCPCLEDMPSMTNEGSGQKDKKPRGQYLSLPRGILRTILGHNKHLICPNGMRSLIKYTFHFKILLYRVVFYSPRGSSRYLEDNSAGPRRQTRAAAEVNEDEIPRGHPQTSPRASSWTTLLGT